MSAVRGPDVSSYQGYPDWGAVKRGGFAFAFCKATEGTSYRDKTFAHNWKGIKGASLVRGAYHFGHAGSNATSEANYFLAFVRANGGWTKSDIPVLDIEAGSLTGSALTRWVDEWCKVVEKAWRPGLIYSGRWFFGDRGGNASGAQSRGWGLWTSAYGSSPIVFGGFKDWTFWQFTDGKYGPQPHSVPSIGNCDISVFNGSLSDLRQYAGAELEKHQFASRNLKEGDSGTDVRRLQGFLNKRLTNRGWPKIEADGHYGPTTEKAKHWATYILGLPTSVVHRDGATARVQHYIRHPSDRPKSYYERANARKRENPDQFHPPKPKPKPEPKPEPKKDSDWRVIQGCPCNKLIAPYIDIITDGATVNSIYRGEDAKAILHAHGKHTQAELYATLPKGQANPPGRSTHELRGDGSAYGAAVGAHLEDWQQGFDVNDSDVSKVIEHAKKLGWEVFQPYPGGVEFHHLNFKRRPTAKGVMRLKVIARRLRLPRT